MISKFTLRTIRSGRWATRALILPIMGLAVLYQGWGPTLAMGQQVQRSQLEYLQDHEYAIAMPSELAVTSDFSSEGVKG